MSQPHTHSYAPGLIDVHCHICPAELPLYPSGGQNAMWPRMCCEGGHGTFIVGETQRRFDDRTWDGQRRIDYMDQHGIGVQVLSPLPELFAYWFDPAETAVMCRHVNDVLAQMIQAHPARFLALGGLPMNDPAAAIVEARRLKRLGFTGVEIGSNINGISPADPRYVEVLATLDELDLAIFVHGIRPATAGRLIGPQVLAAVVGIPMDTALCVSSFIGANVLDRHPDLRVAFSHGGGALGSVIDRFQHVWNLMPEMKDAVARDPVSEARRFYYDILTFSAPYSRFLVDHLGADCLFVGTDFPAGGMGLMDPQGFLDQLSLTDVERAKLGFENARRYLKL